MKWNGKTKKWMMTHEEHKQIIEDLNNTKNRAIRKQLKDLLDRTELK